MKSKLRNITVNNEKFVYWYSGCSSFRLFFSPKENKNIRFELIFSAPLPDNDPHTFFWTFYKIISIYNKEEIVLSIAMPKFIAYVISYLMLTQKELFKEKKHHTINGMTLLNEMGYTNLKPIWKVEW